MLSTWEVGFCSQFLAWARSRTLCRRHLGCEAFVSLPLKKKSSIFFPPWLLSQQFWGGDWDLYFQKFPGRADAKNAESVCELLVLGEQSNLSKFSISYISHSSWCTVAVLSFYKKKTKTKSVWSENMSVNGISDQEPDRDSSIVSQSLKQHCRSLSWRPIKNE